RRGVRVEDGQVEALVDQEHVVGRSRPEAEAIRARRLVYPGAVLDWGSVLEDDQPAGLVRQLGARVLGDRRPHRGRDHHQTVVSIDSATRSSGASQKSALRYFQPPSARIVTTTPSSSSSASRRATWTAAPAETPPKIPPSRGSGRTAATDSSFETSTLRSRRETSRIGGTR